MGLKKDIKAATEAWKKASTAQNKAHKNFLENTINLAGDPDWKIKFDTAMDGYNTAMTEASRAFDVMMALRAKQLKKIVNSPLPRRRRTFLDRLFD